MVKLLKVSIFTLLNHLLWALCGKEYLIRMVMFPLKPFLILILIISYKGNSSPPSLSPSLIIDLVISELVKIPTTATPPAHKIFHQFVFQMVKQLNRRLQSAFSLSQDAHRKPIDLQIYIFIPILGGLIVPSGAIGILAGGLILNKAKLNLKGEFHLLYFLIRFITQIYEVLRF